jgi:hypothetical protein
LVATLEEGLKDGDLAQAEIFLFIDNFTAESVFYKGNSSGKTV